MKTIDIRIDQSTPMICPAMGKQSGKWASAGKGSDDLVN